MTPQEQQAWFAQWAARLETLEQENGALKTQLAGLAHEHGRLQRMMASREAEQSAVPTEEPVGRQPSRRTTSRRGLLTATLGAAAATMGAGALLETTTSPVAAANGSPLVLGQVNTEEASTEVRYDGAGSLSGVMLLANDGTSAASTTAYKAALGGWAAGGAAHVTTGVYGLATQAGGNGVVGSDTGSSAAGKGVTGLSTAGTGVYGVSASTINNATAIYGLLSSATPGFGSAAVLGKNNGTGIPGYGVVGTHAGSGVGVFGSAGSGVGVQGSSTSSYGVIGHSTSSIGVSGVCTSGTGVRATSTSGYGMLATSASTAANAVAVFGMLTATTAGPSAAAVRGQNNDTTANGIGVYGSQAGSGMGVFGNAPSGTGVVGTSTSGTGVLGHSGTGIAVSGTSASTADSAMAIQGTITSTSPGGFSAGVFGQNNGTGTGGIGVYGQQAGAGVGVYGTTPSGSGVYGYGPSGTGVVGDGGNSGIGISGFSNGSYGVTATSLSTADSASALYATLGSATPGNSTSAVFGYNSDTGSSGSGVYGQQAGDGYGVWGQADGALGSGVFGASANGIGVVGSTSAIDGNWAIYGNGNIGATGTKSALIPAEQPGYHRTLYCVESPECWFEDFGSGSLVGGTARVQIDPIFAASVQTAAYHIFLTPLGNCRGLYVSAVDAAGFTVQEVQGGTSKLTFSYRIVARRKDVTAPRLALVRIPTLSAARPTPERPAVALRTKPMMPMQRAEAPATPVVPPAVVVPPLPTQPAQS